jgi:cytochrome c553
MIEMSRLSRRYRALLLTALMAAFFAESAVAQTRSVDGDRARGQAFYVTCAGCHGPSGGGIRGMQAPNLTLLTSDYLVRTLIGFRSGWRGSKNDYYGFQMHGRARALPDEQAIRDVVAYIDALPDVIAPVAKPAPSKPTGATANALARGRDLFVNCASCHGERGEGIVELGAPRLADMETWYVKRQMENFASGIRGTHPDDPYGQQMAAAMADVSDAASMDAIIDYLSTLSQHQPLTNRRKR